MAYKWKLVYLFSYLLPNCTLKSHNAAGRISSVQMRQNWSRLARYVSSMFTEGIIEAYCTSMKRAETCKPETAEAAFSRRMGNILVGGCRSIIEGFSFFQWLPLKILDNKPAWVHIYITWKLCRIIYYGFTYQLHNFLAIVICRFSICTNIWKCAPYVNLPTHQQICVVPNEKKKKTHI